MSFFRGLSPWNLDHQGKSDQDMLKKNPLMEDVTTNWMSPTDFERGCDAAYRQLLLDLYYTDRSSFDDFHAEMEDMELEDLDDGRTKLSEKERF